MMLIRLMSRPLPVNHPVERGLMRGLKRGLRRGRAQLLMSPQLGCSRLGMAKGTVQIRVKIRATSGA